MQIYNALQLKNGAKVEQSSMGSALMQPVQFLPRYEKTDEWYAQNADFLEWQGLKQITRNSTRLMKNYKLAKGIIDKSDYMPVDDNEYRDLMEVLTQEDRGGMELKFYPLVPNLINTFCAEFAKRSTKITYRGVDEFSYNERLEQKRSQIEDVLMQDAQQKMLETMIQQGMDPEDPEVQQQMQQQLSPDALKQLPQIEQFFNKDYRSMVEQWASHQHSVDVGRFSMDELEERAFRNMLIADREFWHFKMMEDDYDIELWNPLLTFYHKSPETRYISQANYVGKIEMMTLPDVIDKYGYLMTEDQQLSLESIYPIRSAGYAVQGYQNDGSYYDATKSHAWNTNMPGLAFRQYMSMYENSYQGGDIVNNIINQSEDYVDQNGSFMLRVSTMYWKGQQKVGYLTKIKDNGEVLTDIIDESYKVTDKPLYNTTLIKNKGKDNLLFGEHIEWFWINQVQGIVKVGPNHPTCWGMNGTNGVNPIYLGINQNKPGPLRYQFKGDKSLYGCKLPVEGAVFSDYNTRSTSLVDLTKPFQIGYNLVNNQIADILIDELGTVILFDQNALPRHSLGEDWGKNNLAKAYVAMKDFQMLPLDTSITNTENPLAFQHYTQLNMEQSNRLMTRINLANHFKRELFATIGVNEQRMGQQMGRETATGVEENLNASYAQTEMYFIQHSDYLMPRVHQMRTDLAQYYNSTQPSVRLQYITSMDERVNFEINGTDLLMRDLNLFPSTKAVDRGLMDELKKMVIQNNTSGASIYDLGNLMAADSMAEINHTLKDIDNKATKALQADRAHEEQMKNMEIEARLKEKQMVLDQEMMEAEKTRRTNILIAEIRAAGYTGMNDANGNQQNDYLDFLDRMQGTQEFQETMAFEQTKEGNKQVLNEDKQNIQREKMQTQMRMKEIDLQIARENKTKSELKPKADKKKSK